MNEQITIFLSPHEAEQFKKFQKNFELFALLDQQGALDINYGKCVINFAGGVPQTIVKEEVVWKR